MLTRRFFFALLSLLFLISSVQTQDIIVPQKVDECSSESTSLESKSSNYKTDSQTKGFFQKFDKFSRDHATKSKAISEKKGQQIPTDMPLKDLDNLITRVNKFQNMANNKNCHHTDSDSKEKSYLGDLFKRRKKTSSSQLIEIQKLKNEYGENIKIRWNEVNGTPIFINFGETNTQTLLKAYNSLTTQQEFAKSFLNQYKVLFKLENPEQELKLEKSEIDDIGFTHLRYFQYYRGIRVWGKDIYFHYNNSGKLQTVNGRYEPTPIEIKETTYVVSSEQALQIAINDLKLTEAPIQETTPEKIIYFDQFSKPYLAWFVEVIPNFLDDFYYFIDAIDGKIIHKYNNRQTDGPVKGSGIDLMGKTRELDLYQIGSTYYMINTAKDMYDPQNSNIPDKCVGVIRIGDVKHDILHPNTIFYHVTSTDKNQWANNAVSLAYNLSVIYDYYRTIHNRTSFDNQTHNIIGMINLGQNYDNAFWQPGIKRFFFGNGDGSYFIDLTRSLDIVAHEFGHAVTQFSSSLEYQSQSGALNEAFSDYSGVMVEHYENSNTANWFMGENSIGLGSNQYAMRDLKNPGNINCGLGPFPAKMSEYYDLPVTEDYDLGGVHVNCTIPGHAFYLITQKIGREKLEKIIYRTYINYLNSQSQFIDLRINAIQAAKDLYPGSGADSKIAEAFDEVEIFDGDPTGPDNPYPSVTGEDYVLMVHTQQNRLLSASSEIPLNQQSITWYNANANNKPSVTEDGTLALYIGTDNNIYMLDLKDNQTTQLSTTGYWHNIAVSPKGDYLAVIPDPDQEAATIYIGTVASQSWEKRSLYLPNTGTGSYGKPDYADILDWSNYGGYLIYDCYYSLRIENRTIDTWGIYLMQAQSEAIISIFQPEKDNIAVGNPAISNTRDYVIAFDYIDYNNNKYYLMTYDLFHGEIGMIHQNQNTFGHPSFSPDDKKIVFQDEKSDTLFISQINLKSDGLNGDPSTYKSWIRPVCMPVWYAVGTRASNLTTLVNEGFDGQKFPPYDWVVGSTVSSKTWKQSNVTDHNFSSIDPSSRFSAVCPFSPDSSQNEFLFSCDFSLEKGDAKLSFFIGYNSYLLKNFSLDLYLKDYNNMNEKLWEAKDDGETAWKWRKVVIDLSIFSGRSRLYLGWHYKGKDGDTVALDGILIEGITTDVDKILTNNQPTDFKLYQNYPNPFNLTTTIGYELPQSQHVLLKVYDILGREVALLVDERKEPGIYKIDFDASHLPSGVYMYRLTVGEFSEAKKLVLIR